MPGSDWDADSDDGAAAAAPAPTVRAAATKKFADEDASDSDVKDDWDASDDSEDEAKKKPKAPTGPPPPVRQKGITKQKIAEREAAERAQAEAEAAMNDDSPASRKAREQEAILKADLDHAAALFGSASVKGGDSIISMPIRSQEEVEALSTALADALIRQHGSKPLYNTFVQAFVKAVAAPLKDVDVRKAASSLTALANEKQKAQKDAASGKKKKALKPGLAIGGKVAAPAADTRAYNEAMDDDYDDDFM